MNAEKFDKELLKRLKKQRRLLEDTAVNMPLPSRKKSKPAKISKKVKINGTPKKRK